MRVRFLRAGCVERAKRKLNQTAVVVGWREGQAGAAVRAEHSLRAIGGRVGFELIFAARPPELRAGHFTKRGESRAVKFTAHAAVTMPHVGGERVGLVGDRTAQAGTFQWFGHKAQARRVG